MRKKLSILFFVILLIASWVALAEGNPSDVTLVKLTDLSIGFGLPGDMAPTEDNATINDEGVPYFAFITEDQHLIVEFYGSNFKDLSEAADWATEHIGEQITKHNVTINGMKAIEYHYVRTMDDGLEIFTDVFFAVNDAEEVFEFWETTDIEERSGLLSSEVYPLSYFSENADLNSEGETASDGAASDSESGTAADGAASASGDETASV
ncbi:MAG: hypothetical protein IJ088_02510, partial [Clostridia bacterium]|nr:hypothetical protein [Clostridia bacterium]